MPNASQNVNHNANQSPIKAYAPASVNWFEAVVTYAKLAACLAVTLVASGCATGPAFTTEAAVPAGQAQVYLYRDASLYASAQSFTVQLNKKDVGELFNGSYMPLQMTPGEHLLSVKPGAFGKTYEVTLQLAEKQTQYFQFELPPFPLGNAFHLGSSLTPRTAEQAQTAMKALKGVK